MSELVEQALEAFRNMAENLGLDDDESESFVDSAMARKGFKRVSSWAEPEGEEGSSGGGDFFSRKRNEKSGQTRQVGGQSGKSGSGWAYGN